MCTDYKHPTIFIPLLPLQPRSQLFLAVIMSTYSKRCCTDWNHHTQWLVCPSQMWSCAMIYLQDSAEIPVSNCPTNKHKHTDLNPTVWKLTWCCWARGSWCSKGHWHLHLPGSSKFLDCLTLEATTQQHCVTSHKTWILSSILQRESALTHPQCLYYYLKYTY